MAFVMESGIREIIRSLSSIVKFFKVNYASWFNQASQASLSREKETEYGTNPFNCHICSDEQANEESDGSQQTQSVGTKPAFAFNVYTGIALFSIF
jgi:hypothetical protein